MEHEKSRLTVPRFGEQFPVERFRFSPPEITKDIVLVAPYNQKGAIDIIHRLWLRVDRSEYWYPTSNMNTKTLKSNALSTPYIPEQGCQGYEKPFYDEEPTTTQIMMTNVTWTRHLLGRIYDQASDGRDAMKKFSALNKEGWETSSEMSVSTSGNDEALRSPPPPPSLSQSREGDTSSVTAKSFREILSENLQNTSLLRQSTPLPENRTSSTVEEMPSPISQESSFTRGEERVTQQTPDVYLATIKEYHETQMSAIAQLEARLTAHVNKKYDQLRRFYQRGPKRNLGPSPRHGLSVSLNMSRTPRVQTPQKIIGGRRLIPLNSRERWNELDSLLRGEGQFREDFENYLEKYASYTTSPSLKTDLTVHACLRTLAGDAKTFNSFVTQQGSKGKKFKFNGSQVATRILAHIQKKDDRYTEATFYGKVDAFIRTGITSKSRDSTKEKPKAKTQLFHETDAGSSNGNILAEPLRVSSPQSRRDGSAEIVG